MSKFCKIGWYSTHLGVKSTCEIIWACQSIVGIGRCLCSIETTNNKNELISLHCKQCERKICIIQFTTIYPYTKSKLCDTSLSKHFGLHFLYIGSLLKDLIVPKLYAYIDTTRGIGVN